MRIHRAIGLALCAVFALAAVAAQALTSTQVETARLEYVAPDTAAMARAGELTVARKGSTGPGGYAQRATATQDALYGSTTAPVSIVEGATVAVSVPIMNTGLETLPARGDNPVHLSYHWY